MSKIVVDRDIHRETCPTGDDFFVQFECDGGEYNDIIYDVLTYIFTYIINLLMFQHANTSVQYNSIVSF